jgi:putative Holliday junction resolvase
MRILAVDPGSKNIGLAISDLSGTIANPLMVIKHISREKDADLIIDQANRNNVVKIIVGQSINDEDGKPTFEGRRSARLVGAIAQRTSVPVELWNEGFSTQDAKQARTMMKASRIKRSGHLDQLAATIILQTYLDNNSPWKAGYR